MRKLRYGAITVLLTLSLVTVAAEPRERDNREPRFLTKVIRVVKFIVQPLADSLVPPHP